MEMKLGKFEALDQQEMLDVDGGATPVVPVVLMVGVLVAEYYVLKRIFDIGYQNGYNSTKG